MNGLASCPAFMPHRRCLAAQVVQVCSRPVVVWWHGRPSRPRARSAISQGRKCGRDGSVATNLPEQREDRRESWRRTELFRHCGQGGGGRIKRWLGAASGFRAMQQDDCEYPIGADQSNQHQHQPQLREHGLPCCPRVSTSLIICRRFVSVATQGGSGLKPQDPHPLCSNNKDRCTQPIYYY